MPTAVSTLPDVGDVLADRYRLARRLGEGGMGIIFEAMDLRLRQRVAVKVLAPEGGLTKEILARFEIEARVCANLRGPNMVRVIDVDRTPAGLCFMAMELLRGRDLATELDEGKRLPVDVAVDVAMQIAGGMTEAHRLGVVHRDLKPPNVFLCELGPGIDRRLAKILDFGISKLDAPGSRKLTSRYEVFGTSYYMSPEHVRAAAEVDARSDIWALGVLLFEMLTGRLPFEGTPTGVMLAIATDPPIKPTTLVSDLPVDLERIILRCLEKNPWDRFGTMEELRAALAPFGPVEPIEAVLARAPREALTGSIAGGHGWESTPPPVKTTSAARGFLLALGVGAPLVLTTVVALRLLHPSAAKEATEVPAASAPAPLSTEAVGSAPAEASAGSAEPPPSASEQAPSPSKPVPGARPLPHRPAPAPGSAHRPVNRL